MSAMKELYLKVAADAELQAKVGKIFGEAGEDKDALAEKLVRFAKEQGYEITRNDVVEFYKSMEESGGQLSDEELDAVAGGKQGVPNMMSGITCMKDPIIITAISNCRLDRFLI